MTITIGDSLTPIHTETMANGGVDEIQANATSITTAPIFENNFG